MTRSVIYFALCAAFTLAGLSGCGGSSSSTSTPPSSGKLYVTNGSTNSILRFKASATGNIAPEASIGLLPGTLPISLALDVPHDRLAAVSLALNSFVILDNVSSSPSAPRIVSGAATTMNGPQLCALDSTNDLLYVVDNFATILVFSQASTISGNVAPLHTLNLGFAAGGIAIDPANNRLFVSDSNSAINVFDGASTQNGNVVPTRVITSAATQLVTPGRLALDSSGRLIVTSTNSGAKVLVFANAGTANGNVVPTASAVLFSTPTPAETAVSPAGDLYEVDGQTQVAVYSNIATASGNISPGRVISGPAAGLDPPARGIPPLILGVALDPTR